LKLTGTCSAAAPSCCRRNVCATVESRRDVDEACSRTLATKVVGPLTPEHTAPGGGTAGYTPAQLNPSSSARNVERHVVVVGPGEASSEWVIVGENLDRALRYTLTVRRTERVL
jgi:hypothetical protein